MPIYFIHPGLQEQTAQPLPDWAYFILSVLFLFALYFIGQFFRKRKHQKIRLAGHEVGLSDFTDTKQLQVLLRTAQFTYLKNEMMLAYVLPILKGRRNDVEIMVFDFIFRKDGPPGSGPKRMAVLLSIEESELAQCLIRPKGIWDKVGQGFQANVLSFDDQPEFDDKYLVTGYDEEKVRALLHPRVTNFLTAHPRLTVEVLPRRLLLFQADRNIQAEDLQPLLKNALALFALLRQSAAESGISEEWKEYQEA